MSVRWLLIAILLFTPAAVHAQDKKKGKKKVEPKPFVAEPSLVPYRLTDTHHTLVRVKINGKGPFNFVVDTGCPVFLIAEPVGKQIGLDKGWVTLDKLELEGGIEMKNVKARVETPFQIEGMNGMGLAGVELHGLMGYTVLAKFKMDYDYNKLQMIWTPLKSEPLAPEMRGVFGFEMEEKDKSVHIKKVSPNSGAEKGGLKAGDRILSINAKKVNTINEVRDLAGKNMAGQSMVMSVERGENKLDLKMIAGADVGGSGGMEMMVMMVRAMTWLLGAGPPPPPQPRGFFGFEMDDGDKIVTVARVLGGSPAAKAGLMKGDRIVQVQSSGGVDSIKEVLDRARKITPGQTLTLMVERGKERVELKITAGDGL